MILGIDLVDVKRFRAVLARSPNFPRRFFTPGEHEYCAATADPGRRFAGTFAAKEAVMKALHLTPAPAWARRIEITRSRNGAPRASVDGRAIPISISHDGDYAIAVAADPGH